MSSATSAAPTTNKAQRVLACVLCQHRKIKCDRNTPCSNCVKANVECVASTPAPARKRRRPNQDLQERLARCEELLKNYATAAPGGSATSKPAPVAAKPAGLSSAPRPPVAPEPVTGLSIRPQFDDPYVHWKPAGKMVIEDGSVTFMDSFLWANVYDELQAMKRIVTEEEQEDMSTEANTPDEHVDLLLSEVDRLNLEDVFPEPVQAFRLWQIFLERVNPLTKVIHVPSLQPYIVEAASNFQNVPASVKSLLFSIYTLTVLSLDEAECRHILRCSRSEALRNYSDGARAALKNTQFLRTYDMPTLQALVLYMLSLQGRYNRHGSWVLNGLLIRIAQKMGLHRDGESLNLTPFDTEMRRRVWWQILMLDAKWAMLSGLSHSLLPWSWDTKTPSNVNDADLFPGSTEPVQPREGPTEMAFCLFSYEIGKFLIRSQGFPGFEAFVLGQEIEAAKDPNYSRADSIRKYRNMIDEFAQNLKIVEDKYTDRSAGPVHEVCSAMRNNILAKVRSMLVPMEEQPEWGTEIRGPKDNLFKLVVCGNEHGLASYDLVKKHGFLWYTKLHFQVDVFILMVGMLQNRTVGILANRAWLQVDLVYKYHDELRDMSQRQNSMLATYVLRAWKAREKAFAQLGTPLETPACIPLLRDLLPSRGITPADSSEGESAPMSDKPDVEMGTAVVDPVFDQIFGGYIEMSAFEWEMLGETAQTGQGQAGQESHSTSAFGSFGGGAFGGPGPSGTW